MILDTTFLVDLLRGDDAVGSRLPEFDEAGVPAISSVTVMELWEGIHRTDASERERAAVESLLADLHERPFDRDCATTAGGLNVTLADAGQPIRIADVMIAATALVHEEPVVTRNVDHFERIDGLDVVEY